VCTAAFPNLSQCRNACLGILTLEPIRHTANPSLEGSAFA
jgi:hypothetical protein